MKKIRAVQTITTDYHENRDYKQQLSENETYTENAKSVIFGASNIENILAIGIGRYYFGEQLEKRKDFEDMILSSDFFSFSAKRKTFLQIVRIQNLLKGSDFSDLERITSKVMKHRNLFTHGTAIYTKNGCEVRHFEGESKIKPITDEFLTQVEIDLGKAFHLCKSVMVRIQELRT